MDTLYSVEQVARLLGGISRWTVHAWLSQGRIKKTKIGSRTMVKESDLVRFIEESNAEEAHKPSTRKKGDRR